MTINFIRIFGWSAYLCCSWMWCIGMFYPVLLYRDFGIASWFIFTIPNVIGATLVPWFIKDVNSSKKFIIIHSFACQFFSFVTILFNVYFLLWTFVSFKLSFSLLLLTILLFFLLLIISRNHILPVTLITFFISLCALLIIFVFADKTGLTIVREENYGLVEALGLVPVFLIGFFFCPYLDLTFHRVIRESRKSQTKLIYVIGFLIFFLGFLILNVKYFPIIYHTLLGNNPIQNGVFLVVCSYIIIQCSFTSIAHLNELLKQTAPRFAWILFVCFLIIVTVYAVIANGTLNLIGKPINSHEIFYIGFLAIYGLFAPLYVWLFIVIKFGKSQKYVMNYKRWLIWLIAILLSIPFYILGFYGNLKWVTYALPIGVLLALLTPFKSVFNLGMQLFLGEK